MKKELFVFIGIFLFLAIGMHYKQWLNYPVEHLTSLPNSSAYGFGFEHPFVFTLIIYLIVWVFRFIIGKFSKKSSNDIA